VIETEAVAEKSMITLIAQPSVSDISGDRAVDDGTVGIYVGLKEPEREDVDLNVGAAGGYRSMLTASAALAYEPVKRERDDYVLHEPGASFQPSVRPMDEFQTMSFQSSRDRKEEISAAHAAVEEMKDTQTRNSESAPNVLHPPTLGNQSIHEEWTVKKHKLGKCTMRVLPEGDNTEFRFHVKTPKSEEWQLFKSLNTACDYVWCLQHGYESVAAWRAANIGKRKVPSGAGEKFWGKERRDPVVVDV
jgi:hypothetical protein